MLDCLFGPISLNVNFRKEPIKNALLWWQLAVDQVKVDALPGPHSTRYVEDYEANHDERTHEDEAGQRPQLGSGNAKLLVSEHQVCQAAYHQYGEDGDDWQKRDTADPHVRG